MPIMVKKNTVSVDEALRGHSFWPTWIREFYKFTQFLSARKRKRIFPKTENFSFISPLTASPSQTKPTLSHTQL